MRESPLKSELKRQVLYCTCGIVVTCLAYVAYGNFGIYDNVTGAPAKSLVGANQNVSQPAENREDGVRGNNSAQRSDDSMTRRSGPQTVVASRTNAPPAPAPMTKSLSSSSAAETDSNSRVSLIVKCDNAVGSVLSAVNYLDGRKLTLRKGDVLRDAVEVTNENVTYYIGMSGNTRVIVRQLDIDGTACQAANANSTDTRARPATR